MYRKKCHLHHQAKFLKLEACFLENFAQQKVAGKFQAQSYASMLVIGEFLQPNPHIYRFGDCLAPRTGRIKIRIPIPTYCFIPISIDVVGVNVPMKIGSNFLDKEKIIFDNVDELFVSEVFLWEMPKIRKYGHLYYI